MEREKKGDVALDRMSDYSRHNRLRCVLICKKMQWLLLYYKSNKHQNVTCFVLCSLIRAGFFARCTS